MTSTYLLTTIAVMAMAIGSTAAVAQSAQGQTGITTVRAAKDAQSKPVLRAVPNNSLPTQPGYAWRYFSNPRAAHAVMISSSGEYFLSLGDGPQQITWLEGRGSATPPMQN